MVIVPSRFCPRCGLNRHVTTFVPGNALCSKCRSNPEPERVPGTPLSATELLAEFVRRQALTNPKLAEKQDHLIQTLRSQMTSDQEVLDYLLELFGLHL